MTVLLILFGLFCMIVLVPFLIGFMIAVVRGFLYIRSELRKRGETDV